MKKINLTDEWQKIPLLKVLIFYITGILAGYFDWTFLPELFVFRIAIYIVLAVLVLLFLLRKRQLFTLFVYLFFLLFGVVKYQKDNFLQLPHHFTPDHQDVLIGIVNDQPQWSYGKWKVPLKVIGEVKNHQIRVAEGNLLARIDTADMGALVLEYGDLLVFKNSVTPVNPAFNPMAFDYQNYLQQQRIYYQISLKRPSYQLIKGNFGNPIVRFGLQCRSYFMERFKSYIPQKESYAIAVALILGERSEIDEDVLDAFSKTGTIHILSVSGMHVAVLYGFWIFIFGFLPQGKRFKLMQTVFLIGFVWFYALLTGFSPSVLRAVIMLSFIIIAKFSYRDMHLMNSLMVSAFIILWFDARMLFSIGFQLSYLAVMGISVINPIFTRIYYTSHKAGKFVLDCLYISLSAQLMTSPLVLYYFGLFPTYFLIANLFLAIPATVIMIMGLLFMLVPLPFLGMVLGYGLKMMTTILSFISGWKYSAIEGIYFEKILVVFLYVVLFLGISSIYLKSKKLLFACLTGILIFGMERIYQQMQRNQYQGFRIYNTHHEFTFARISKGLVEVYSTFDQLQHKSLKFAVKRDLERYCSYDSIRYFPIKTTKNRRNFVLSSSGQTLHGVESFKNTSGFSNEILIIRKNIKWGLEDYLDENKIKLVILDASNSSSTIDFYSAILKEKHIPYYILKNNYAYVWTD